MNVISLGWGVQSFTLAAMVALGELEPVEAALHADTTHESSATYEFAQKWTPWLEERGVRVVTVQAEAPEPITKNRAVVIPAFTQTPNGKGMLRRQCTGDWKVRPMRCWLRQHRRGRRVVLWLGISLDEVTRMRDSDVQYIVNRYPLVERRMTRAHCVSWLKRHGLDVPPKSACVFCPFRTQEEWLSVLSLPMDKERAIAVDEAIRKVRPPYDLYVHPSMMPLNDIDFQRQSVYQLSLWDEECSGVCGV